MQKARSQAVGMESGSRHGVNSFDCYRTARCVKILGKGVVKVVHRCNDAKENSNLGQYILCMLSIL